MPGGLQSMGSQRVGHGRATFTFFLTNRGERTCGEGQSSLYQLSRHVTRMNKEITGNHSTGCDDPANPRIQVFKNGL